MTRYERDDDRPTGRVLTGDRRTGSCTLHDHLSGLVSRKSGVHHPVAAADGYSATLDVTLAMG